MGPVHTQDNDLRTSGAELQNWQLSRKGLICLPGLGVDQDRGASSPNRSPVASGGSGTVVATSNHYEAVHIEVINFSDPNIC